MKGMWTMKRYWVFLLAVVLIGSVFTGCSAEASDDQGEGPAPAGEELPAGVEQPPDDGGSAGTASVDDVRLDWILEGSDITVTVSAPTDGWIAVGFEPAMAMKDADIIIGYVSEGEAFLRDDWGDGPTSHKPDVELGGTDDLTAVSGTESEGSTTLTFTIPLNSGDEYDRALAAGTTVKVILAYGRGGADDYTSHHAWAETIEIEL